MSEIPTMLKINIIFLLLVFLTACSEEPVVTTIVKKGQLELLWQTTLREDNEYAPSRTGQIILKDYIVFFYDAVTSKEKMLFVNKKDFKDVSRFYEPVFLDLQDRFFLPEVGLIVIDFQSIFTGHSAETMKKVAEVPNNLTFGANNKLIGDYLYMDLRDNNKKENYVIKVSVKTGEITYDWIVKESDYPEYDKVGISSPNSFVYNNTDTFFSYNILKRKNNFGTFDILNVDKKTNGILWEKTKRINGFRDFHNFNNNLICEGGDSIYCIEPYSGDIIWKTPYIASREWKGWVLKNMLLNNNRICFLDQGHFVEINAVNGNILYDSPVIFEQQSNSKMTYFEGVYYWTAVGADTDVNSYIYGLRASDKKIVLKMKSPNAGKAPYNNDTNFDWNGLQIDPETRLGYTSDGFFAMCFKIPESYE